MRSALHPLAVLALAALPLTGCVFEEDGDRRPVVNETIIYNSGIQSEVFTFDGRTVDYTIADQQGFFRYETDRITDAVYDGGLVMLYADGGYIDASSTGDTWTALPLTFGTDFDPDGDGPDLPDGFVDVTTTLGFSFEPGFLYVEALASSPLTDGFDYLRSIPMRLVTIPRGEFLRAQHLDFSDYDAVQRFYGIEE